MITLDEFIAKYQGKTKGYPTDNDYNGECLSIVKLYIKECFGINPPPSGSNSAYGYWSNFPSPLGTIFKKIPNDPTAVPKKGDIPIWKTTVGAGFGHIDIFIEGDVNRFKGFDQNWNGRHAHFVEHDYKEVVGWLTPIKEGTNMVQVEDKKFEELVNKATKYDAFKMAGFESVEQVNVKIAELSSKIGTYEAENKDLKLQVKNLTESQGSGGETEAGYVEAEELLKEMLPNGGRKIVRDDGTQEIEISYKLKG